MKMIQQTSASVSSNSCSVRQYGFHLEVSVLHSSHTIVSSFRACFTDGKTMEKLCSNASSRVLYCGSVHHKCFIQIFMVPT